MPKKNDQKFRIKIRNWDDYQSELKGKGERRRRRQWIAISVNLFSDPDFLELDHVHARLWLGMLLHAGKVGPEFSLTPARAVSMFCLRRPCDFQILANQGFIDLEKCNKQGLQTNKEDIHTVSEKKKPDKPKSKSEDDDRLVELKAIYPKRSGSQPWARALKAINARIEGGAMWSDIADGVRRYAEFCHQTDKIGTEYVMMAATFCGPDKHYEEPWDPPTGKAERRLERNIEAGTQWAEEDNGNN